MELLKYITKYIHPIRTRLFVGIFFLLISIVLSIIHPILMGEYIDRLSTGTNRQLIVISVLTLAGVWLLSTAISYLNAINNAHMSTRLIYSINFHLLQHTEKLPFAILESTDTVYLNSRIHNDSATLAIFFLETFINAIANAAICLIVLCVIFYKVPFIGVVVLLLLPIYTLIFTAFKDKIAEISKEMIERRDSFFGEMQKQLRHIRTIKLNAWYERLFNSLIEQFDPVYKATVKSTQINSLYQIFTQLTQIVANLVILLACGIAVSSGSMKLGSLVAINSLFATLFSSFASLMNFGRSYANATAAYKRVLELEMTDVEENGDLHPEKITEIRVSDLSFQYPSQKEIVISHASLKFESGKIYQLSGENGCGKSTLLNLLLGLYATNGKVCYDGIQLEKFDKDFMRQKLISVIEQEPPLVFDHVSENIVSKKTSRKEMVNKICSNNFETFVGNLDLFTDRNLSDGTIGLSEGEKQKVAILRALLKDSDVLVFDEPTSALDSRNCAELREILKRIKENKIIILVDHQSTFSDIVDVKYRFYAGNISKDPVDG